MDVPTWEPPAGLQGQALAPSPLLPGSQEGYIGGRTSSWSSKHRTLRCCLGDMKCVEHRGPLREALALPWSTASSRHHMLSWLCWIPGAWWGGVLPILPTPGRLRGPAGESGTGGQSPAQGASPAPKNLFLGWQTQDQTRAAHCAAHHLTCGPSRVPCLSLQSRSSLGVSRNAGSGRVGAHHPGNPPSVT